MSRDIPIMFSTPMVLALLAGRKLMTRRLAWKEAQSFYDPEDGQFSLAQRYRAKGWKVSGRDDLDHRIGWPPSPWQKVKAGDRLWVREEWRVGKTHDAKSPSELPERKCTIMFAAGGSMGNAEGGWSPDPTYPFATPGTFPDWAGRRRASMHLPRWGSRLTLLVKETKIERLQAMSHDDAIAEGVEAMPFGTFGVRGPSGGWIGTTFATAPEAFSYLWMALHGPKSWDANPEVVAVSFSVVHANIDAIAKAAA